MISFPNAKINLGLRIVDRRPDGYHTIESCLYPIELCDVLEIIESKEFSFESSGLLIDGKPENNLVVKAYDLLCQHHNLPPVSIHLHKVISMGAGLGGGSSDGTHALIMLNDLFDLQLTSIQLTALAGQLGSDCPFFIKNKPCIARGTGTELEEIDLDLNGYEIRLEHPDVHVSTAEAYAMIIPRKPKSSLSEILEKPVEYWQGQLTNDFELPMENKFPEIREAREKLLAEGAVYAAMTGSGSSVFGVFRT